MVAGVTMLVTSGLLKRRGTQGADDSDDSDDAGVEAKGDDSDCPDEPEDSVELGDSGALESEDIPEADR